MKRLLRHRLVLSLTSFPTHTRPSTNTFFTACFEPNVILHVKRSQSSPSSHLSSANRGLCPYIRLSTNNSFTDHLKTPDPQSLLPTLQSCAHSLCLLDTNQDLTTSLSCQGVAQDSLICWLVLPDKKLSSQSTSKVDATYLQVQQEPDIQFHFVNTFTFTIFEVCFPFPVSSLLSQSSPFSHISFTSLPNFLKIRSSLPQGLVCTGEQHCLIHDHATSTFRPLSSVHVCTHVGYLYVSVCAWRVES